MISISVRKKALLALNFVKAGGASPQWVTTLVCVLTDAFLVLIRSFICRGYSFIPLTYHIIARSRWFAPLINKSCTSPPPGIFLAPEQRAPISLRLSNNPPFRWTFCSPRSHRSNRHSVCYEPKCNLSADQMFHPLPFMHLHAPLQHPLPNPTNRETVEADDVRNKRSYFLNSQLP